MKSALLIAVLSLLTSVTFAEVPAVEVGLKGGVSFAFGIWREETSWNDIADFLYHPALYGQLAWNLTPRHSLVAECGYAGRGMSVWAGEEHAEWVLHYIDLPLSYRHYWRRPQMDVWVGGGAYLAAMLAGTYDFDAYSISLFGHGSLDLEGTGSPTTARRLDYGASIAGGMEVLHVFAEMRLVIGIADVLDFTLVDGRRRGANADFQVLVGWKPGVRAKSAAASQETSR
jgi:hypothetical protein